MPVTRQQAENIDAGDEMDALVLDNLSIEIKTTAPSFFVLNGRKRYIRGTGIVMPNDFDYFNPSRNLDDAIGLLEIIRNVGFSLSISISDNDVWWYISALRLPEDNCQVPPEELITRAKSLPLAICRLFVVRKWSK